MKEVLNKIGVPKQVTGDDEWAWSSKELTVLLNVHNMKKDYNIKTRTLC